MACGWQPALYSGIVGGKIMRKIRLNRRRQRLVSGLLLGLLLFRAYVPVGFMPASGTPFLLELCPEAGPMPVSMDMATDMPMDMSMDMAGMPVHAGTPMDASMPMPMRMAMDGATHHQHSGVHGSFDHCPFGSVPGAGPISQIITAEPPGCIAGALKVAAFTVFNLPLRKDPAHPTRGPPSLT
jgi:hypothetical protein